MELWNYFVHLRNTLREISSLFFVFFLYKKLKLIKIEFVCLKIADQIQRLIIILTIRTGDCSIVERSIISIHLSVSFTGEKIQENPVTRSSSNSPLLYCALERG